LFSCLTTVNTTQRAGPTPEIFTFGEPEIFTFGEPEGPETKYDYLPDTRIHVLRLLAKQVIDDGTNLNIRIDLGTETGGMRFAKDSDNFF
jgi:hypothetical protein